MNIHAASRAAADLLHAEVGRLRSRGIAVGEDDLRGLYISDQEADRILEQAGRAGQENNLSEAAATLVEATGPRLAALARLLSLSPAESAVIALAFVTELNPEVERLVAYIQDDVSRKRPRVEVLLRLFWDDTLDGQSAFDLARPLRKFRLIELHDDPGQPATPLLSRAVTLDPRIARYLAGGDELDERLAGVASLHLQTVR